MLGLRTGKHICRYTLKAQAVFLLLVVISFPFLGMATATGQPPESVVDMSIFGLHPDLVKGAFYLISLLAIWQLTRTLVRVDNNQTVLFDNQRKLATKLAELITAHNINHGQAAISVPDLSDGGGKN